MSWLRRSSILLFALSASAVAGCSDDGGTQGPRPDAGLYDAAPPPDAPASFVAKAEAHWVTRTTIAVPATMPGVRFELHHAPEGGIGLDGDDLTGSTVVSLTVNAAGLPDAVTDKFPHLAGYKALTLAEAAAAQASEILKGQLVLAARDDDDLVVAATSVQIPGVLDDLYAAAATTAELGVTFADEPLAKTPTFRLWAPTARKVSLKIYAAADKAEIGSAVMTRDDASGVWSYTATDDAWYGSYYRYEVEVFAPRATPGGVTTAPGDVVVNLVTDPYSLGLSTNSQYSLIVNLNDPATKPTEWNEFTPPDNFEEPEDIVLYEVHVRDFSIGDETVAEQHRGKYLAFTYNGTVESRPLSDGMAHLQRLSQVSVAGNPDATEQGITHVHLLPVFDIATINENAGQRVDIDVAGSVAALCERLDDVVPAVSCSADAEKTIRAVLEELLEQSGAGEGTRGDTEAIQALVDATRPFDGYNWGYDPFHYTAPEGSYATNPEGITRILEFRAMVMGLGAIDLRAVMDVVYNHTNASGQDDKSVLDRVVPGYYHRQNPEHGTVERSTCCENTATEHAMMEKLMLDSVVTWAEQYKIAGFRFDLMGHHMKSNMVKVKETLQAIDPTIYVYGEGWDFGEVVSGARGENATQQNLAGTEIGTFSDRLRDGVRGGGPFDGEEALRKNQGFINGMSYDPNELNTDSAADQKEKLLAQTDLISLGMAANLKDFVLTRGDGRNVAGTTVDYNGYEAGYTEDPADVITYVAAHDNQTLFDNNQYKIPTATTMEDRARMQVLGLGITILAQGIPFLHMGEDILRSKSMARDSYDYGDWFNKVDFSYPDNAAATNNWNVGLPPREKDASAYPVIRKVIADASITPRSTDMALVHAMTRELLFVRRETRLFRLRTGDDVKKRVDFHNVGPNQVPGLIVMTVTDGVCAGVPLVDLDPGKDNVAVLINATDTLQRFDATGSPLGGKTWSLHRAIETGSDPRRAQIVFENDVFEVPARTIAVFLDLQSGGRGPGICNTKEAEDVPPPGGDVAEDVYLRGTLTDPPWDGFEYKFARVADGRYEVVVPGLSGVHEFKVADDSWSTHNWGGSGASPTLVPGGSLTLASNGGNILINLAGGDYKFVLDTTSLIAPVLSLEAL